MRPLSIFLQLYWPPCSLPVWVPAVFFSFPTLYTLYPVISFWSQNSHAPTRCMVPLYTPLLVSVVITCFQVTSKIIQIIDIALGCITGLESWSLCLKILRILSKHLPCGPAFMISENNIKAVKARKAIKHSYPTTIPLNHNNDHYGNICIKCNIWHSHIGGNHQLSNQQEGSQPSTENLHRFLGHMRLQISSLCLQVSVTSILH